MNKKQKKALNRKVNQNNIRVQDFFEIKELKENCLLTTRNEELYYIQVTPINISVQSDHTVSSLITSLSNIVRNLENCEILCLNSSQNYNDNKQHLIDLKNQEQNENIKRLDEEDIKYLDDIRADMATSRVFFIVVRCHALTSDNEKKRKISDALQICREHKFRVEVAGKEKIKKMLSIYLEQNIYNEELSDYDGQQYLENSNPEEYNLKDFVDLIAPSVMDFKHANYYIIGNTYRTVWAVRSYATSTKQQALLKSLGEQDGVTLHIYNRLVNPSEQKKIFENAEHRNRSKSRSTKETEKIEGEENLTDLGKMIKKAHKDKEAFIHCAVYVEMTSNSLEKLKDLTATVSQVFTDCHIVYDALTLQQRDGFVSASPFGFNIFKTEFERVLPSSSVGNLFPFSYSGKTDPKGIPIGKDVNGSYILTDFDMRDSDKTNGHISIFGNSGEGKSYFMKLLICIFRQQRKSVYSCDVDAEIIDSTRGLGGTNLDMMSGKYFINILEPKFIKSDNNEDDNNFSDEIPAAKKDTKLSRHIAYLRDFFKVYKPELTSAQLDILEIMLVETYKLFHITNNTDFTNLKPEDFPIPSDLYNTVENALNNYDDVAHRGKEMIYLKDDCRKLLLALNSLCVGTDSMFFNGYTNIPNSEHVNFILKDMLSTNENLKNAMYFNIFSFMQHKYFAEGNTSVFLDELHEIIKSRTVVDYVRSFVKRGRKKESNIIIASQNIDDLMLPEIIEYTRPLFSIPTHRFLFFPGIVDVDVFTRTTNLTSSEFNIISKSHQGFCLYCCGDERYHLHVIVPPYKSALFGTAGGR